MRSGCPEPDPVPAPRFSPLYLQTPIGERNLPKKQQLLSPLRIQQAPVPVQDQSGPTGTGASSGSEVQKNCRSPRICMPPPALGGTGGVRLRVAGGCRCLVRDDGLGGKPLLAQVITCSGFGGRGASGRKSLPAQAMACTGLRSPVTGRDGQVVRTGRRWGFRRGLSDGLVLPSLPTPPPDTGWREDTTEKQRVAGCRIGRGRNGSR